MIGILILYHASFLETNKVNLNYWKRNTNEEVSVDSGHKEQDKCYEFDEQIDISEEVHIEEYSD